MSALQVSLIVFACVFAGSILGMLTGRILPEGHLQSIKSALNRRYNKDLYGRDIIGDTVDYRDRRDTPL